MTFRLSWSQFNMHSQCPYKWYGFYVLKLIPYSKNIHFTVGSATHEAIEFALNTWNTDQKKTVAEMVAVYSQYLKKDGITDPDQLQYWTICGQNMLQGWYRWMFSHTIHVEMVEWKINTENFVGIVDCVALVDNQRYIIDWKTSASKYSQKRTNVDGQLTTYQWLTKAGFDTKVAQGVLVKGTSVFQFVESSRTKKDVDIFLLNLQKMRDVIKFYPKDLEKRPSSKCKWCDLYTLEACEGEDDF